jgi:GNAT superfamily N-acetyltransferase
VSEDRGLAPLGVGFRPARFDDLPDCGRLWRDGINDYARRLGQPDLPAENPGLTRLHAHALETDPQRFLMATRDGADGERSIAFGSAVERGSTCFLSMLFVDPEQQVRGIGRAILDRILPRSDGHVLATATDTAQPIANALYASLGIVPRMPLFNLLGRPRSDRPFAPLPAEIAAERFDEPAPRIAGVDDEIAAIDREVLGFEHPQDHAWVRAEPRTLLLFRQGPGGGLLGYGYASVVGRVGPIAVRRPELLAAALGFVLDAVQPRGASSVWLPGAAGEAVTAAFRSGFRIEAFPILLAWNRPFADFARYVPTSPGLL